MTHGDCSSETDSGDDGSDAEYTPNEHCKKAALSGSASTSQCPLSNELAFRMPTWQRVRCGSGRGAAKIEWGTRVVIYSMLSMLVPPSAIGPAIVAVVKRTAPWLEPKAPTTETVRRCRFELRLVEEALTARRVAAAYRIRCIGFDETTKLGNSSLTSNVSIEPTPGAPLQDVVLRAAYCPMGGTSELQIKSIEERCFARLRGYLSRWKAMFDDMFPNEKWTGPDGQFQPASPYSPFVRSPCARE